jgi:VWFA-related protein
VVTACGVGADFRVLSSHLRLVNYFKSLYLTGPAAIACIGMATAQPIAPDEMRAWTFAYAPPTTLTLRTQVDLVEVPVVVRDGRRALAGLTKDDFELYDTGKKQTITAFSVQHLTSQGDSGGGAAPAVTPGAPAESKSEPRPRFVALCFDDLHTAPGDLKAAKDAAERFVKTGLAPRDRVAVVTTSHFADYEFTEDVPKLVERIAKVAPTQRGVSDDPYRCPYIRPYEAYVITSGLDTGKSVLGSKLYECKLCQGRDCPAAEIISQARMIWEHSLFHSMNTVRVLDSLVGGMAKLPGQRMILLASAGFLMGNVETDLQQLMVKALHAEVVINTLDAKRLYTVIPGGEASNKGLSDNKGLSANMQTELRVAQAKDDGMAVLASGTGGTFYHDSNDLARGFRELGMVPETMYVLGFAPSDVVADGRFHGLKVRLTAHKRYSLQARSGYTAPSANAAAPVSPLSKLESEVTASDTVTDLPAWFTWEQWAGLPGITMVAHLDVNRLRFENFHDRRAQRLVILAVLLDSSGGFVTGKRSEVELYFKDATFAQLVKTGLTAAMTLQAPPGSYSVRAVAQDGLERKLAAASATVQIK